MSKSALVISGGGAKGAFAVGVLKYIKENRHEIDFNVICGTSTGALIAPLAATGDINSLERLYTSIKTEDILLKGSITERFLNHNSVFNVKPLKNLIDANLTGEVYNRMMNSGKEIFISTVCLQTGKITYFTNSNLSGTIHFDMQKFYGREEFMKAIVASSDQPVLMPPIDINGKQYVDGGVREYIPMQAAIASGCTDIYAVILSPDLPNSDARFFTNLGDILFRTIDLFSQDVSANDVRIPKMYSDGLKYISEVKQRIIEKTGLPEYEVDRLFDTADNPFAGMSELNIHIIRPDYYLGGDGLEFIPSQLKQMLDKGYSAAASYFSKLPA